MAAKENEEGQDVTAEEKSEVELQEETEKGMLDAVQKSLAGEPSSAPVDTDESADDDEDAGKEPAQAEGDAPQQKAAEEEEKPTEPKTEEPAKPEAKAEEKPAEPEKKPDTRPSDKFGTLPENTKKETKERFDAMRAGYDEQSRKVEQLEADLEKASGQYTRFLEAIQSTGATPEQYGISLEYMRLANSRNPADLEAAYEMAKREYTAIAKALGKEGPGVDPLADHPDLAKEVEEGSLSRERAMELVSRRSAERLNTDASARQQKDTQAQQERQQAIADLRQLGQKLRGSDPHYKAKERSLIAITTAVEESGAPPSTWAATIEKLYKELPSTAAPASPGFTPPKAPTPITGGQGPGSAGKGEPGTALEAMQNALAEM